MAQNPAAVSGRRWVWWKPIVSLLLIYHLAALIVAPSTVPPSPQLFRDIYPAFGPWVQFLNMNQGNQFFAPEPGASTLVGYAVETADGRIISGRIPNREIWPRLLYHRHFMLTESLANFEDRNPRVTNLLTKAFARELLREHHGVTISLTRVTHYLALMDQVRSGMRLDAAELYEEEPLGRFSLSELETPRP